MSRSVERAYLTIIEHLAREAAILPQEVDLGPVVHSLLNDRADAKKARARRSPERAARRKAKSRTP